MRWWAALVLAVCGACRSVPPSDLTTLSDRPPAPYSVLVSGGAFVVGSAGSEPFDRTFGAADAPPEAVRVQTIVDALEIARTFVRVAVDDRGSDARREIAVLGDATVLGKGVAGELLARASAEGFDYVLVVERVLDGPVVDYGINTRWPITLTAWITIALGMVIPDHTFESAAQLEIAMRDVHSGRAVYRAAFDAEPIDLSLVERGSLLGIISSIILPPFWIPNDEPAVVEEVRRATRDRLLFLLAENLKSDACRMELVANAPGVIEAVREGRGARVRVSTSEGLSLLRLTLDGVRVEGELFEAFRRELFASAEYDAGGVRFEARLALPTGGGLLQVLVQTNGGLVGSTTVDLRDPVGENR